MLAFNQSIDGPKFEMAEDMTLGTKIKVLGVGGGGGNAVARMMQSGIGGVEYYVLNTDRQALLASPVPNKLAIGTKVTNGLGAGSDPAVGRQAALEDTEKIIEILESADMVFVTAGLGGGTGTGAAPVVASLAKELNALTVAVVTKPFRYEGPRRMQVAERGLAELAGSVDTVITIPNTRLLEIVPKGTSFLEAFRLADDVLRQAVQGISDIITTPGLINRDFADIRTIMLGMGYAMMTTAMAEGENAAIEAARKAIANPLLEDGGVRGARGVLINMTSSSKLAMSEVDEACSLICEATENPEVDINYGMVLDEEMGDQVKITVIATGFRRETLSAPQSFGMSRMAMAAAAAAPAASEMIMSPIAGTEHTVPTAEAMDPATAPEGTAYEPLPVDMDPPRPVPPQSGSSVRGETSPANDIDTPAFLRRERRLYQ